MDLSKMRLFFYNFSVSFFDNQLNRFDPSLMDKNVRLSSNSSKERNFSSKILGGLELISVNINS